jgi:hypothetical protein
VIITTRHFYLAAAQGHRLVVSRLLGAGAWINDLNDGQ